MGESHGTVVWSELITGDVEAAKEYYATVCGWTFDAMPMGDVTYHVAKAGETMVAGIMDLAAAADMPTESPVWLTYLAVDDVDKAAEQTRAGGGKVLRDPWDVPGVGRIAMVRDPSGGVVGLMTPAG